MSFDPESLIGISKLLMNGETEAHCRSYINRSYYAAFGFIKKRINFQQTGKSVHNELIKKLLSSDERNYHKAGKFLEVLFRDRKLADYDYSCSIDKRANKFTIENAQKAIDYVKNA